MQETENQRYIKVIFHERKEHSYIEIEMKGSPCDVEDAIISLTAFLSKNVNEDYKEKVAEALSQEVKKIILNPQETIKYTNSQCANLN